MLKVVKKNIKYILNIGFIVLISWLIFRMLFKGQELSDIIKDLHLAHKGWLILGVVFVFFFVAGESVIIKYMLNMFKQKVRFRTCLKYSFIGFFFSCITPSSSGGQPAQMYYMKKDGIKLGFSTLIMLIITVAYKAVLVVLGIIFLIFKYDYVMDSMGSLSWLLWVGFILNAAYIVGLMFIFFKPLWARKMGIKLINFLTRIKLLKDEKNEQYISKITRICDNYMKGAEYIKENVHTVFNIFLITVVQRTFLFAVTWIVYKAYHLSGTSLLNIIILQTMIGIACEMLPLPGAAGVTEGCFIVMFEAVFGSHLRPAMLLSRGLSFYVLLFMSGAVTLAAHIIMLKKNNENIENEQPVSEAAEEYEDKGELSK